MDHLKQLIDLLEEAQSIARNNDIGNITQPGIIKEIIIAYKLGHTLNSVKKHHDAQSIDGKELYEYLTTLEGGTFQLHRIMRKHCMEDEAINRIRRNDAIFCATFSKEQPLVCLEIIKLFPSWLEAKVIKKCKDYFSANPETNTFHFGINRRMLNEAIEAGNASVVWELDEKHT
ncbi:MAG: hypothetical protein ACOCZ8_01450 [Bacteroidota bacterium]